MNMIEQDLARQRRERFVLQAMHGLLSGGKDEGAEYYKIAIAAVRIADATIAEMENSKDE